MNITMVPKKVLDEVAGFSVGNLINERQEVTLLGESWDDAKTFKHKDFWKAYRNVTRSEVVLHDK